MKKLFTIMLIAGATLISSCTKDKEFKTDAGTIVATPYGLANQDVKKIDGVTYELSAGDVFWSIIFSETIVVPVYLVGWRIYQPVQLKTK